MRYHATNLNFGVRPGSKREVAITFFVKWRNFPCPCKMKTKCLPLSEVGEEFSKKRMEGSLEWSLDSDPSFYYKLICNLLSKCRRESHFWSITGSIEHPWEKSVVAESEGRDSGQNALSRKGGDASGIFLIDLSNHKFDLKNFFLPCKFPCVLGVPLETFFSGRLPSVPNRLWKLFKAWNLIIFVPQLYVCASNLQVFPLKCFSFSPLSTQHEISNVLKSKKCFFHF